MDGVVMAERLMCFTAPQNWATVASVLAGAGIISQIEEDPVGAHVLARWQTGRGSREISFHAPSPRLMVKWVLTKVLVSQGQSVQVAGAIAAEWYPEQEPRRA